jgi:hypothetical protein
LYWQDILAGCTGRLYWHEARRRVRVPENQESNRVAFLANGRTDGQMGGRTNRQMDGETDGRTDEKMDRQMEGRTDR